MVRIDSETGNLIIEIKKEKCWSAVDELLLRREALFDLMVEHNTEEFATNGAFYGAVKLLQDLEPTTEQWEQILQ